MKCRGSDFWGLSLEFRVWLMESHMGKQNGT